MNEPLFTASLASPIGLVTVVASVAGVRAIHLPDDPETPPRARADAAGHATAACRQLREYFDRRRTLFDLPLDLRVTPFQQRVLRAVAAIPYGETRSYGAIAAAIGRPRAARAVGGANHANPIAIVIPCHRVIGADGSLTGYGGGLDLKAWMLAFEGATAAAA